MNITEWKENLIFEECNQMNLMDGHDSFSREPILQTYLVIFGEDEIFPPNRLIAVTY